MPGHGAAPVTDVIPAGAHFHHWRLGFKQSSLGHIVRVLRHPDLDASSRSPLPRHALVPDGFPLQVSRATHEPPSESIPAARGIQRSASRRTPDVRVSAHPAQASPRDPLPQAPYVVLSRAQRTAFQLRASSSGPFTTGAASNLSLGSGPIVIVSAQAHLTRVSPLSRPGVQSSGPGIRPVIHDARLKGTGPPAVVSCCLSATGIRFSGHPHPAEGFRLPHGRPTEPPP
jgi:hypothetical protein